MPPNRAAIEAGFAFEDRFVDLVGGRKQRCRVCGVEKPLDEFRIQLGRYRRSQCTDCEKAEMRLRAAARYAADPEPQKAASRRRRSEKRELCNAEHRRWRRSNPEANARIRHRARLFRRLGKNKQSLEYAEIIEKDPCSYCGAVAAEVDHIDPVARSGDNSWSNLTSACSDCNKRKTDRPLLFFLAVRNAA